jgi:hypothetical protein
MLPSPSQSTELGPINIEAVELAMLLLPNEQKVSVPVHHYFGPGVYIRQITIPKGSFAIGHEQRFDHTNILLQGAVAMYEETGVKVLQAPMIFTGKPGRKIGMAIEDCVWLNIFATDETDIAKLEEMIAKKSDTFKAYELTLEAQTKKLEVSV